MRRRSMPLWSFDRDKLGETYSPWVFPCRLPRSKARLQGTRSGTIQINSQRERGRISEVYLGTWEPIGQPGSVADHWCVEKVSLVI